MKVLIDLRGVGFGVGWCLNAMGTAPAGSGPGGARLTGEVTARSTDGGTGP